MLLLYALLIWRALRILVMSKDLFGSLVAAGVVAMLMFQVFVNVGMTIGIMPITGVTLPLMSYGGSSVITTLLAVGLLQSIYVQARASASAEGPRTALLDTNVRRAPPPDSASPTGLRARQRRACDRLRAPSRARALGLRPPTRRYAVLGPFPYRKTGSN